MADPLVSDELAVGEGEGLEAGALGRQLGQRGVRDQDALLQVHPLQLVAAPRQGLTNTRLISAYRMAGLGLRAPLLICSVADTHHVDADPEPSYHFDADPELSVHFDGDPDPSYHFDAGTDSDFI